MNQVLSVKETHTIPSRSQLRHLPELLSKGEKQLAAGALLLILVAGTLLTFRLVSTQTTEAPAVGGEYTEGLVGSPQLVNPLYSLTSDVDTDLSRLIYTGLMRYDAHDGLVPDLAESYEISDDQKTYTFILRDDVKWHDGNPLRAGDIVFTINAMQTQEYRSPLEVSFAGVAIEQIDERTVRFILQEPFAPFLSLMTVGILPSHLWADVAPINAPLTELNTKPIGTGPYKFEKLVKDSKGAIRSYTLERNTDFYRGAPYIERLNFKFYSDSFSAIDALKNNNVEGLSFIPTEEIENFEKVGSLQLIYPALHQYTAAFINLNRTDKLGNVEVRKALAHATNKQTIVDTALQGHGTVIDSFILPGMIGDYPEITKYEFNPDAAREALSAAGWEHVDNSTVRTKGGVPLQIEIVALNSTELVAVAEELKRQWADVGVDVQIKTVDNATFQSDILKNRSYDILLSGELYGIDPDPYAFWHSSQSTYPGLNLSAFSNRNADGFIETGRTTTSRDDRATAYKSLQDIVTETVPAIFLYQPSYTYAISKKIRGVDVPQIVIPADRFAQVNEWHIKTKKTLKKRENTESLDTEIIEPSAQPTPETTTPETPEPNVLEETTVPETTTETVDTTTES